jgi:hypothetical protein
MMIDNGSDDDLMLDAALSSWLAEAFAPMRDVEGDSWIRFAEETLPEKDAWVQFSVIMARAQQGVHQAIDRGTRSARGGAVRFA